MFKVYTYVHGVEAVYTRFKLLIQHCVNLVSYELIQLYNYNVLVTSKRMIYYLEVQHYNKYMYFNNNNHAVVCQVFCT